MKVENMRTKLHLEEKLASGFGKVGKAVDEEEREVVVSCFPNGIIESLRPFSYPKIPMGHREIVKMVPLNTIILGKDDLDPMAFFDLRFGKPVDDISQTPHFGYLG